MAFLDFPRAPSRTLAWLLLRAASAFLVVPAMADEPVASTVRWNFTTAAPTSGLPADVTGGTFTQGNNNGNTTLITSVSVSSGYAGVSGGNNAGAAARVGTALDPATSAYFEFTLAPAADRQLGVTALSFGSRSTGTGPQAFAVYTSGDNFTAPIASGPLSANGAWASQSPAVSGVTAPTGTAITFRIYGFKGAGNAGTGTANWRIDDLSLGITTVAGAPSAPRIIATTPLDGASGIGVTAPVVITFNQPVNVTGAWFTLVGSVTGAHDATVTGGPSVFTLAPIVPFAGGETVTVAILSAQVTDQASGLQNPEADFSSSFTTLSSLSLAIHTVQGTGLVSAYATQTVTVQGVVVASFQGAGKIGGYYLEAPDADHDSDPATSEGIYVFDNANSVTVGDLVTVTGTVTEFGTAPASETELSPVSSFTRNRTGTPLPSTVTVTLPFPAAGYAERYEGMLVTLPQPLTVTDNFDLGRFGEVVLSNGRLPVPTNIVAPGIPARAQAAANQLNQLLLDDGVSTTYPNPTPFLSSTDPAFATRRTGSTTAGVTGILDNKFGTYVIEPTVSPAFVEANPRGPAPASGGTLRIAIGNVENFMNGNGLGGGFPTSRGATTLAEYQRQLPKVTAALLGLAPDIMGLTEIENDRVTNGAADSYGPTSALAQLVVSLNAAAPAGTTYAFVNAAAVDITTDEIHVAFIYRTETVELVGGPAMLNHPAFNNMARNPLAQTFREKATGEKLTVCINHFKSKGSAAAGPGNADSGDGQGASNALRVQEAEALVSWLASQPTGDPDPKVLVLGDLNAYAKEDPIMRILDAGYINLTERFERAAGYSYAFNGEFGHLDHALASPALNAQVVSAATWHVNADEPVYYDYNVENKSAGQLPINAGTPFRYSDHDPVVIGVDLGSVATLTYQAFIQASGLPPSRSGYADDPEGDGVGNLLEYFMGLDPAESNPAGLPQGKVENGEFVFRFNRGKSITGVTYEVQASIDLVAWAPLGVASLECETGTSETLVLRLPIDQARLFARLVVSAPASAGTVATVPVGYMNFPVAGGSQPAPVTTALGFPLDGLRLPEAGNRAGVIESFTANTLASSASGWVGNLDNPAAPWYVRLVTGPMAGKLLDVVANTATSLTVSGADLSTLGLTAGVDTFELVPGDTLLSLLGSSALQGGTSAGSADNVQVSSGGTWLVYYYDTNLGYWRRNIGPATNSNNVRIRPGSGIQITRRGPATTLTLTGRVLATPFRAAVNNAGTTVLNRGFPTDTTLGALAIQASLPGWRAMPTAAGADQVFVHDGTAWRGYFSDGSSWLSSSAAATDSDSLALPAGTLLTVQRSGTTAGTSDLVRERPYLLGDDL